MVTAKSAQLLHIRWERKAEDHIRTRTRCADSGDFISKTPRCTQPYGTIWGPGRPVSNTFGVEGKNWKAFPMSLHLSNLSCKIKTASGIKMRISTSYEQGLLDRRNTLAKDRKKRPGSECYSRQPVSPCNETPTMFGVQCCSHRWQPSFADSLAATRQTPLATRLRRRFLVPWQENSKAVLCCPFVPVSWVLLSWLQGHSSSMGKCQENGESQPTQAAFSLRASHCLGIHNLLKPSVSNESMVRETTNLLLGIRKLNPTFLLLLFRQKKRNIRQMTDRQTDNKPKRKKMS